MIFLIFLAIIIILILCLATSSYDYGLLLFFLAVFLMICPVVSVVNHSHDLAMVRNGNLLIETRNEAIKDINNQLKNMKINQYSLMNADSPVRSLTETKAKFVEESAQQKLKIANAKINIEARSIGFMSGIVKIMGKE